MASEWITTTEAAELSGYHPEHLRRLIREGNIKSRKFGIVWQVDKSSLSTFMGGAKKSGDKRRGPKQFDKDRGMYVVML